MSELSGQSDAERVIALLHECDLLAANVERERRQKLAAWRLLERHGIDGPICDSAACAAAGDCSHTRASA